MALWSRSRRVRERIFIRGLLHLDTPTHFGGAESEGSTDMPLLYDSVESSRPLLTGTSIAGALRNYLREYEKGYQWLEDATVPPEKKSWAEKLFGYLDDQPHPQDQQRRLRGSVQSWLMIDDALGNLPDGNRSIEIRDGVALNPKTRTAYEGKKFDLELLAAGTTFPISFEFWLSEDTPQLLEALAIALQGLEQGKIGLGKRKRRGYGRCHVSGWQVWRYQMSDIEQVLGWLTHYSHDGDAYQSDIYALLNVKPSIHPQINLFHIEASFGLDGSLFIRSYGSERNVADTIHLRSWRDGLEKPVLSGTSLAGALRARAFKIANTLDKRGQADDLVIGLFGGEGKDEEGEENLLASRLWVDETVIEPKQVVMNLVQSRVSIDRFTGGARDTALFNEQPVWGRPDTCLTLNLRVINPTEADIGLLLLLLKDLWTGDLPLGGEISVGRGRLKGRKATLTLGETVWEIRDDGGSFQFAGNGNQTDLQDKYLQAFLKEMGHES